MFMSEEQLCICVSATTVGTTGCSSLSVMKFSVLPESYNFSGCMSLQCDLEEY